MTIEIKNVRKRNKTKYILLKLRRIALNDLLKGNYKNVFG